MRTHWNRQSPPQLPKPLVLSREQVLSKPDFREAKHTSKERFSWGRTALGALSLVGVSSGILAGSVSEAVNVDLPAQTSDSGVDLNHQKECSLVLVDYFESSNSDDPVPHGDKVQGTAELLGVTREISRVQVEGSFDTALHGLRQDMLRSLDAEGLSPDDRLGALKSFAEDGAVSFVRAKSHHLDNLRGWSRSAVNFSLAYDKAKLVEDIFEELQPAWSGREKDEERVERARLRLEAVSSALGPRLEELLSESSDVHGPARQRLQQSLIDLVSSSIDQSPELAEARSDWKRAVADFEASHNSVVIAAGNSAHVAKNLKRDNGGHALALPDDFETSLLEIDEVTSVGAVEHRIASNYDGNIEIPAVYGSKAQGVDIYAFGGFTSADGRDAEGTSFAAPRVSTTMTAVHCTHPEMTSLQVQDYIINEFGRGMEPVSQVGEIVLDLQSAEAFVRLTSPDSVGP